MLIDLCESTMQCATYVRICRGCFVDVCGSFADVCGSFADVCGSFVDVCGSFGDVWANFADVCVLCIYVNAR